MYKNLAQAPYILDHLISNIVTSGKQSAILLENTIIEIPIFDVLTIAFAALRLTECHL